MIKALLLIFFLFTSLLADKVLYLSYKDVPKRVVKGEIFSVTLKILSTVKDYDDIGYEFSNYYGLEILNPIPHRELSGKYVLDKFFFKTTKSRAKLPTITASLIINSAFDENSSILEMALETHYDTTRISGKKLNVITLNPKKNYSNIIANSFELVDYKTTSFDNKYNIIIFIAKATNTDITTLHFNNVRKQGIESSTESYLDSRVTFYAIIDKKLENFSFSYFNLIKNKYILLNIPIEVIDDSVTTQTDLKPKDQSRNKIKAAIAIILALFILAYVLIKKEYIYIFVIIVPLGYVAYIMIPSKEICIKQGSDIHLLPVKNGTIFEKTQKEYHLLQEGSTQHFIKVKLYNEKIGWVKNEDICSY